jgi:lysophospholipase L1-like esterase
MQARGAQDYDVVLCALGVNDVTHGATPAGFVATLSKLLDHLQTQRHAKHVVLTHLPPMGQFSALPQPLRWVVGRQARRLDRAMQELVARRMGCIMLDHDLSIGRSAMASDGFHPGPLVYASWGQRAAQVIAAGVRPS